MFGQRAWIGSIQPGRYSTAMISNMAPHSRTQPGDGESGRFGFLRQPDRCGDGDEAERGLQDQIEAEQTAVDGARALPPAPASSRSIMHPS